VGMRLYICVCRIYQYVNMSKCNNFHFFNCAASLASIARRYSTLLYATLRYSTLHYATLLGLNKNSFRRGGPNLVVLAACGRCCQIKKKGRVEPFFSAAACLAEHHYRWILSFRNCHPLASRHRSFFLRPSEAGQLRLFVFKNLAGPGRSPYPSNQHAQKSPSSLVSILYS
jgi:hypothetical protein